MRGEPSTGFWWGQLRERDHLGDPGLDGWINEDAYSGSGDMDWIELAQDREKWRGLVNALMVLRGP